MERHLADDGRVFIDMPDDPARNPCLDCGACCQHFRVSFYGGESDAHPGGFVPDHLIVPINPVMACMKGTETGGAPCVALTGVVGLGTGCSIYANRPTPCREFPVWMADGSPNPACQRLRPMIGKPPLPWQPPEY
ncbi:YkgJ family cysteine cluster protein [Robbsia sp. Bb-Pol-6]|uniref:YkgJ family cysteine cluster protein n=1 Tax=Robbsia betulipollinis TaxID=2981849 RepID=A0ABT3ZMZ3_9BURK|nr:YkgJ family cysteine cluster protein [Robbsia betulipollinis]MCY0387929.1 YkgJ family cysteine cluster protein [Robbsia betulipollinis]